MVRTTLTTLVGMLAGIVMVGVIVRMTNVVHHWMTSPKVFEIEHGTLYLTVVLGAGFGAVCGALIGGAGTIARALRERRPPSGS